jgi:drug/metabolite transporter (DMT)-like permease
MPLSALALALAAAVVHALWNLLLARARDTQAATAVALVVATVAFAPIAAVVWRADGSVWPYVVGSSCFEIAYFALLAAAYSRAELSLVYPLARGSAPVLVLLIGVVLLGAGASVAQVAGVLVVAVGVVLVRGGAPRRGVLLALTIGTCIAAYTLIDKRGIRHASPITYLELTMVIPSLVYATAVTRAKGMSAVRAAANTSSIAAGAAVFGAYALVLAALQRAPAASVAAVRETGVVIAALLAVPVLHERVSRARLVGACLVVAGIAALARA